MPLAKRRVRFGEAALQAGYVEPSALDKALAVQKQRDQQGDSHKLLGIILLEMGAISSEHLIEILKVMNNSARLPAQSSGSSRLPLQGKNGSSRLPAQGTNGSSANHNGTQPRKA